MNDPPVIARNEAISEAGNQRTFLIEGNVKPCELWSVDKLVQSASWRIVPRNGAGGEACWLIKQFSSFRLNGL